MQLEMMNPTAPARATMGLGYQISAAAIEPDHTTTPLAINRIQRRFGYSMPVAALVAQLAGLGPQAVR